MNNCSYDSLNDAGEPSVPCNTCGTPCILRTANTANNRGRKFYSCQSQDCSFFVYVTQFTINVISFSILACLDMDLIELFHSSLAGFPHFNSAICLILHIVYALFSAGLFPIVYAFLYFGGS